MLVRSWKNPRTCRLWMRNRKFDEQTFTYFEEAYRKNIVVQNFSELVEAAGTMIIRGWSKVWEWDIVTNAKNAVTNTPFFPA